MVDPFVRVHYSEADPQSWLLAVERDDRRDALELELEECAV